MKTNRYNINSNFDIIIIFSTFDKDISLIINNKTAITDSKLIHPPNVIPNTNFINNNYNQTSCS